jgi:FkbM family methyltransferase
MALLLPESFKGICRMYNPDWLRYCKRVVRAGLGTDHLLRPEMSIETRRIGSAYGGWIVAPGPLGQANLPVVLSFGLGDDISFDEAIIQDHSACVYGFDPTPASLHWIATRQTPPNMQVLPIGIAAFDGEQSFAISGNEMRGNFSCKEASGNSVMCKVRKYDSILAMLKLHHVDVLKLDVEGAEYDVIPSILSSSTLPVQLLIEFHHRIHNIHVTDTRRSVAIIRQAGFSLFAVSPSGQELSFIRN